MSDPQASTKTLFRLLKDLGFTYVQEGVRGILSYDGVEVATYVLGETDKYAKITMRMGKGLARSLWYLMVRTDPETQQQTFDSGTYVPGGLEEIQRHSYEDALESLTATIKASAESYAKELKEEGETQSFSDDPAFMVSAKWTDPAQTSVARALYEQSRENYDLTGIAITDPEPRALLLKCKYACGTNLQVRLDNFPSGVKATVVVRPKAGVGRRWASTFTADPDQIATSILDRVVGDVRTLKV